VFSCVSYLCSVAFRVCLVAFCQPIFIQIYDDDDDDGDEMMMMMKLLIRNGVTW